MPAFVADVVQRADMRMAQARDGFGFALEPVAQIGIARDVLGQDLDRNDAVEARIAGFVDLAHAADADQAGDLIDAEARSGCKSHGYLEPHPREIRVALFSFLCAESTGWDGTCCRNERPQWVGCGP